VEKPQTVTVGKRTRLVGTQIDVLCYLASKYGPLDAWNAEQRWLQEYPTVDRPCSLASMFRPAVAKGRMVKVGRGIYAVP